MTLEFICANCKNWETWSYFDGTRDCRITENARTLGDMWCQRFESTELALVEKLRNWKPCWFTPAQNLPLEHQLVLMMYNGEPKPKVGYCEDGVWYKSAGSRTAEPDFWTKLP